MFSFDRRKREAEMRSAIGRIIDITSPNLPPPEGECRVFDRFNRTIPVLLTPWENDGPVIGDSAKAVTKDISDQGVAVVLQQPFRATQVLLGFWLSERQRLATGHGPTFLLGRVRQNVQIGGGFWQLGIELGELVETSRTSDLEYLVPAAAHLLPENERSITVAQADEC